MATFVHPNYIVCLLMLMGMLSLAAYLQLHVVWVYKSIGYAIDAVDWRNALIPQAPMAKEIALGYRL
ncbi:hypothetical protein GBN16_15590 [Plesiomonas shigelloides]|nr:hypothetical protein GBN16_15590 [Plesiomonas shigelloides]